MSAILDLLKQMVHSLAILPVDLELGAMVLCTNPAPPIIARGKAFPLASYAPMEGLVVLHGT